MNQNQISTFRKNLFLSAKKELYRRFFPTFCEEQLKIIPKEGSIKGVSPFVFNKGQRKIWTKIRAHRFRQKTYPLKMIVLKARQVGASTYFQGLGIWNAVLFKNITALTMAHDSDSSENIHRMTKLFYRHIDKEIKPPTQYDSKRGYEFKDNNSRILIQTAGNVHAGASFTINFLHLSEVARYKNPDMLDTSFFPSVPNHPSSTIIIESTAKAMNLGSSRWFKDMWEAAGDESSGWIRIFIPWFFMDDYSLNFAGQFGNKKKKRFIETMDDEEKYLHIELKISLEQLRWRRLKIVEDFKGDIDKFRQEFPSTDKEAWISSGNRVFDMPKLRKISDFIKPPEFTGDIVSGGLLRRDNTGPLWIWKHPQAGEIYDIGVDVGAGKDGGNPSTIQVIQRAGKQQVAEWKGLIDPIELAIPVALLGTLYNNAQVAVEVNSVGYATQIQLSKVYYNIYRWRHRDELVPRLSKKTGWHTTKSSKGWLVSLAKHLVLQWDNKPFIRSQRLMNELLAFVSDGVGSYYAMAGGEDDLVIAWMIALMIANDEDFGVSSMPKENIEKIIKPDEVWCDKNWEKNIGGRGKDKKRDWLNW